MSAASRSNFQGGWVDWLISASFLRRGTAASHSSSSSTTITSGANPSSPTTSGWFGRAQQDDRVALVDELAQLLLLGDDPCAGPVDDLEALRLGAIEDIGPHAVGADDNGRTVVDVVESFDRLDAEVLELAHDAVVVDHLSERVRRLAGGRGLLGLVDRLANAIAEPGALGDADFLDGSHAWIIAWGPVQPPSATGRLRLARGPAVPRRRRAGRGQELRDAPHDEPGREALGGPSVRAGRQLVGDTERAPDADGDRPPGCGNLWPRGHTSLEPPIPIGTI